MTDGVHLISDFIAPSEVAKARQTCLKCGKYLDEKRKYGRLKKPCNAIIHRKTGGAPAEGRVVDVSGVGALMVLNEWVDLPVG